MGNKEKVGTGLGSVLGGTLGAVIGKQAGKDDKWVIVGGVTGALLGGLIGNRIGHAFDERDRRIKEAAKAENLKVETEVVVLPEAKGGPEAGKPEPQDQKGLQKRGVYALNISEIEQFPVGSATLTPNARRFFETTAETYKKDGYRNILIVGHTDSTGDPAFNQRLSEARARTVAQVFVAHGFPANKVFYQGAGASEPVASNASAEGMARNRRVEVADAETTEGLIAYKQSRVAKTKEVHAKDVKKMPSKQPKIAKPAPSPAGKPEPSIRAPKVAGVDFGGVAIKKDPWPPVAGGAIMPNPPWNRTLLGSIIPAARASEPVPDFFSDFVPEAGAIKSMSGKDMAKPSDHLPGYYKQPLYGRAGTHFVYLKPVTLLKDGTPARVSELGVILNYDFKKNQNPNFILGGSVITYPMEDGVLYRWKASSNAQGILGADIRLPVYSEGELKNKDFIQAYGKLYYIRNGEAYVERIDPQVKVLHVSIDWGI